MGLLKVSQNIFHETTDDGPAQAGPSWAGPSCASPARPKCTYRLATEYRVNIVE